MIAFMPEPIKAWCNGKRVLLLGIQEGTDRDGRTTEWAVMNAEDGKIDTTALLSEVVTEWHWDAKKNRWEDVSEPEEDEDG